MEQVSEGFKSAIKNDIRRIYGYVDIIYDLPSIDWEDFDIQLGSPLDYSLINNAEDTLCKEVLNGIRRKENYASLENNYFKLDGSFILPSTNYNNENCGFISNNTFDNFDEPITINIKSMNEENSVNFKYMTIYFKDNNPRKLNIKYTYNNVLYAKELNDIDDSMIQVFFENQLNSFENPITIEIVDVEYYERRIRIEQIDFGLTNSYRDNNLIDFTVTEEIDKLNVNMPINTVSVNIGDYEGKFDYLNPNNFISILNDNVYLMPYIGILTETNGVEYVKMGNFYLTDWKSNADKTVTFNASDLFYKLSDNDYVRALDEYKNHITLPLQDYLKLKSNEWKIPIKYIGNEISNTTVNDKYVTVKDKRSSLQELAVRYGAIVNCNREGVIEFKNYNNPTDYSIELSDQLELPSVTAKTLIKNLKINEKYYTSKADIQEMLVETLPVTFSGEEIFYINFNELRMTSEVFCADATGTIESVEELNFNSDYNWIDLNFAIVKIVGNGSGNLEINSYDYEITTVENNTSINETGDDITINNDYLISLGSLGSDINLATSQIINFYKSIDDKYSYSLNWIGDPSVNVGDNIKIATRFGDYKEVFVTKLTTKFNGGLSGTLEGLGK